MGEFERFGATVQGVDLTHATGVYAIPDRLTVRLDVVCCEDDAPRERERCEGSAPSTQSMLHTLIGAAGPVHHMSLPVSVVVGACAIAELLALSAFFSCRETAIFSLSGAWVEALVGSNNSRAAVFADLRCDPHRLLVIILAGTTS